jgi:hypothetical protein
MTYGTLYQSMHVLGDLLGQPKICDIRESNYGRYGLDEFTRRQESVVGSEPFAKLGPSSDELIHTYRIERRGCNRRAPERPASNLAIGRQGTRR